ncbi:HNH endonuclease [Orenia marismortui]|uniref:HNH endonuclease n=1 Tax=Orenia marismortui TaxID=46469 RepID=A0A4R8GT00_9FIRM|nr:HNH endonuclease [Orenia marismortui]TDX49118.1 HNH endonuclease [Orenia marismortui]
MIRSRLERWFPEEYEEYKKTIGRKYTVDDLRNTIEKDNYKLVRVDDINGYINIKDKAVISCPNPKHESYEAVITGILHRGNRCKKCYLESLGGENNPSYNPELTEEDRKERRSIFGYKNWRLKVYERDNFTCQKCGDDKGGNLVAHHIESFRDNPDLRLAINNGITLCEKCHNNFHNKYGYGSNTRNQFNNFME